MRRRIGRAADPPEDVERSATREQEMVSVAFERVRLWTENASSQVAVARIEIRER